jgi:hypothetical protein
LENIEIASVRKETYIENREEYMGKHCLAHQYLARFC